MSTLVQADEDRNAGPSREFAIKQLLERAREKRQVFVRGGEAPVQKGRRAFFNYSELGVTSATEGRMRAQVVRTDEGITKPTGWHFHVCETQFLYFLQGWVDLAFEDGSTVRMHAGDSLLIPGGVKHNELATSEVYHVLEVSLPAEMGTVPCDAPIG